MRATRTTWETLLVVSCVSLLALGCPPPKKSTAVKPKQGIAAEEASSAETKASTPPTQSAKQFGEEFLKAVTEGKATPEQLTVAFKKAAFPTAKLEAEIKLGYSDTEATRWLRKPGNPGYNSPTELLRSKPQPHAILTGTVKAGEKTEYYLLRLVKNQDNKWLVDWFQQTPIAPIPATDGDSALAQDSVQFFLDNLTAGDVHLAAAVVSNSLKAKMAPPLPSDQTAFNEGFFHAQLNARKELFKGYTLGTAQGSGNEYTFPVKTSSAPALNFKVVKDDKSGLWLVDGL